MRRFVRAFPSLLVVVLMLASSFGPVTTSFAGQANRGVTALTAVGPTDPGTGFPNWYKDANGTGLLLCNAAPNCIVLGGAPAELFYFMGDAIMDINGSTARLRVAVEATYVDANQNPIDRMTFGRISFRAPGGLTPGQSYVVTHPYGQITVVADADGGARSVTDVGCAVPTVPPSPCDFGIALSTGIGPFLTAVTPAPPAGYIGDPTILQTVTGSPTGNNLFSVVGPGVNVQTDQWNLMGKKAVVAANDTYQVAPDANFVPLDVLANDTVAPGDVLSIVNPLTSQPASGSATLSLAPSANKWIIYSTSQNNTGADPFTYTATNGSVNSTGTVNLTVRAGVNAAPLAAADTATIAFNGAATTINVLTNDSDPNSDLFFVKSIGTAPTKGTAAVGAAGRNVTYTPTAGQFGADSFTYIASDGSADAAPATVTININRPPVGVNDTVTVAANSTNAAISVLANDTDPDANTLTVSAVTQPAHGATSVGTAGANAPYTPTPGFGGADSFTYTVSDGAATATATVNITVDRAPVAASDTFTVTLASANNPFSVLTNDSDPDGNTITVSAITQPAHGAASVGPGGTNVIYTPNATFAGSDPFTYTITDGFLTATGNVAVVVNQAPLAANDVARIPQNSTNTVVAVLANDSDPDGNTITVTSVTQPTHGTASVGTAGANAIYTPAAGFAGVDSFSYTISDGTLTASASVSVTVERAPLAANDAISVAKDSVNNILNVLTNDLDPDGNPLSVVSVSQPTNGSVSFPTGGGNLIYTPTPGYAGPDVFTYTVSDGLLTASATVNVTVNRRPVAANDSVLVNVNTANNPVNVLANDTDPDTNALTVSSVTQGTNGTVSIGAGGANVLYTPNASFLGADTFTYTVSDGNLTAAASVNVTVHQDNRAPVTVADTFTVNSNTSTNSLDVMLNDSDPDANPILITSATQGAHGTTALDEGGHHILYTPAAGFSGADTFTYTITDGNLTATGTATVNVQSAGRAPLAANDTLKVPSNSSGNQLHVLDNDSDPSGNPLMVTTVTPAAHGAVSVATEGHEAIYTPTAGFAGADSFTYTVSNGSLTATATANVQVHSTNSRPLGTNDSFLVVKGSIENHLFVLNNDSDPDGDSFFVSAVTQPAHGTAVAPEDGDMVHYTPNAGFAGNDSFSYTIKDGALTATATVVVTVNPTGNTPPVAVNDTAEVQQGSSANRINVLANDSDPDGDSFAIVSTGTAAHGTASVGTSGADVTYTPSAGFSGSDSFTYTISDGQAQATATVAVTVAGSRPPTAVADTFTVPMNSANNPLNVRLNDSDPDGKAISVSSVTSASNGTVAVGFAGANLIYTPNPTFSGSDSFSYTISDGALNATTTVNITIHFANNPPMAVADRETVAVDSSNNRIAVLSNDSDPDSDPVSVLSISQGTHGRVAISPDRGSLVYTPDAGFAGSDSFSYTINDGAMTASSSVSVSVQGSKIYFPVLSNESTAW